MLSTSRNTLSDPICTASHYLLMLCTAQAIQTAAEVVTCQQRSSKICKSHPCAFQMSRRPCFPPSPSSASASPNCRSMPIRHMHPMRHRSNTNDSQAVPAYITRICTCNTLFQIHEEETRTHVRVTPLQLVVHTLRFPADSRICTYIANKPRHQHAYKCTCRQGTRTQMNE